MSNMQEWRWRRWDVRADGKVFWVYNKNLNGGQQWVTWDHAIRLKESMRLGQYKYSRKTEGAQNRLNREKRKKYVKDYNRFYEKTRRSKDPLFALIKRLRCRICSAIAKKGYTKHSKTTDIIGCSWHNLKTHIESMFVDGMSWENRHLWHIDHIIPLASAKSKEELIKLNHYTNLQPLWASDNIRKGSKLNYQQGFA